MLDTRQAAAIQRAIKLDGAAKVQRVEYGVYLVPSATREGMTHVVTGKRIDGADLACDCEAGSLGKPCWHAAAVMIAKMEHASRARVLGPAPVPAPAASTPTVTRHPGLKRIALT